MGFYAAIQEAQLDSEVSGCDSTGFSSVSFSFLTFSTLSQISFLPLPLHLPSSLPGYREASPASEQDSTGNDAAPQTSALPAASSATLQGEWLPASATVGPAHLLPPTPALASWLSSTTPGPPKASLTIEKLPYVPHSPFHLFSYDFEDSPLSTKEKETEPQKESR